MPLESVTPSFARDLARIHKVITRGLDVGARYAAQFAEQGFPGADTQQGFRDYVQSLNSVLGAHHRSEDEIGFPALRLKLPDAPYGQLAAGHREIERILGQMKGALEAVALEAPRAGLVHLASLLTDVAGVWRPHIQTEESSFSQEAVTAVMDPDEQGRLSATLAQHSQALSTPNYLVAPFLLFNLEAEDRAAMVRAMPQIVVEQLVPIVWKDQWAPMKPFLLD